jgi:ABC-2 type transport system permease protein
MLSFAATLEVKNINTFIIDNDNSDMSEQLIRKLEASQRFTIIRTGSNEKEGMDALAKVEARLVLRIPANFERDLVRENRAKIQSMINAEDPGTAGLIQAYTLNVLTDFNRDIILDLKLFNPASIPKSSEISERYWYNTDMDYKKYMAPGILVVLVTFIGMFLTGMNIVREKEIGTIEQLNVTPIKKYQFLAGKLIPYWIIDMVELAFGLTLAKLFFDIPMLGNLFLLFGLVSLYLLVVLGAGLLISTITETQQQSMFLSWFFAVIFILMSGLFTPIDSMPHWAQIIAFFNPIAHFIEIVRRVLIKGSGFTDVLTQFYVLCGYAVVMFSAAIWRFKKTSG